MDNMNAQRGNRFTSLRTANEARQAEWDGNGHANNDDWRMNELMGEVGEVCNVLKKLHRERVGVPGSRATKQMLADELSDVVICLDLFLMTRKIPPAHASLMMVQPGRDPLTAWGRALFARVARLETFAHFDESDVLWSRANEVYEVCLTLAAFEDINLDRSVARKFNDTTKNMGLTTYMHVPG